MKNLANYTLTVEQIEKSRLYHVFNFDYDFYVDDLDVKQKFEEKFIDTYYFNEIGFETIPRFQKHLQAKLNLIMPYYAQLYQTEWERVRSAEAMMNSKDLTETTTRKLTGSQNSNYQTDSNVTSTSSGDNQTHSSGSNNHKESSLADGVAQASLEDGYLTGASNDENQATASSTVQSTGKDVGKQSGESMMGNHQEESITFHSKGDIGIQTPAYAITEWRKVILNIDRMIIEDCHDLFLKIY